MAAAHVFAIPGKLCRGCFARFGAKGKIRSSKMKFVLTLALTCFLSPGERTYARPSLENSRTGWLISDTPVGQRTLDRNWMAK
jgi:hypothetical protein